MGCVILKNADLLTMTDGPVIFRADLLLSEGKIQKIEKNMPAKVPEDARVIDCSGCTLMPGLIDSHVHYDDSYMGDFFLAAGVTSVRNMRGYEIHARWRDEILSGQRRGPYIYSSGPVYDGEDPTIPDNDNEILHTKEDVEEAIRFTKEHGFLWMKTYPSIEPELYKYLLQRCMEEGLPVCGHMTKRMDHTYLAEHGYVCCEHVSSLPSDPDTIRRLAMSGMWLCPTHVVCETMPDYVWGDKKLEDIPHYQELPKEVQDTWERDSKITKKSYHDLNVHPDFEEVISRGRTFLAYSDKIMAGTDCAYQGIVPGFALHDELEKLVSVYRLSAYDALYAATAAPAAFIGISDQKGSIREGMDADLILLEENPLDDISNIRRIRRVFQGTRDWDAEALQQLMAADSK